MQIKLLFMNKHILLRAQSLRLLDQHTNYQLQALNFYFFFFDEDH